MIEGFSLLTHATLRINDSKTNQIIYIDPFKIDKPQEDEKTEIILITHSHFDHFHLESIAKLYKKGCTVIVTRGCEEITNIVAKEDIKIVNPDEDFIVKGIRVSTIASYNNKPESLKFHPKQNEFVGYILTANNKMIYHAGDTDNIPEMKTLANKIDFAFLPIGGTYTMDVNEAAKATQIIMPKIVVPMHCIPLGSIENQKKAQSEFKKLVENQTNGKVNVELLGGIGSFD
ncbi:MAG: MBL fold metallo-hydrolase [Candidatus Micrarchaeota archaeon]